MHGGGASNGKIQYPRTDDPHDKISTVFHSASICEKSTLTSRDDHEFSENTEKNTNRSFRGRCFCVSMVNHMNPSPLLSGQNWLYYIFLPVFRQL